MLARIRPIVPPWSAVAVYAVLVLALWPVPVLNILHVESAAIVALAAYFVAGLHALPAIGRGVPAGRVVLQQVAALAVPWLLLTITLLWTPNCGYFQGLLFFLLFPVITVLFAVALAYALAGLDRVPRKTLFVLIGLAIAIGGPIYDVGFHPQLYTYNHVFGGFLGPIYDEELAVRSGLFVFRGLTLLWAGWLFLFGLWVRGAMPRDGTRSYMKGIPAVVVLSLLIGLVYVYSAPLGINTPERFIQQQLGGHFATTHFDIYFDPDALSEEEVQRVARSHEYHHARLAAIFEVDVSGRIASYIYPSPDVKAALTGARYTSVAPVWLASPQMHLLQPRMGRIMPHELAHVFSREFGLPVINASLAVGLVEGLAVAVEPPSGRPDPHDLVAADLALGVARRASDRDDLAAEVARRLSPQGFWTGRGAVSYTTMGSFVRYLIERYGIERIKRVYARGNFREVYGKPLDVLASEWQQYVTTRPIIARAAADHVSRRFAVPSLFEQRCPHYLPRYQRRYRRAAGALAEGDSVLAMHYVDASLDIQPTYRPALDLWARLHIAQGAPDAVIERLAQLESQQRSAAIYARLGEAYVHVGRPDRAEQAYHAALARTPLYDHEQVVRLRIRAALVEHPETLPLVRHRGAPANISDDILDQPAAQLLYALRLKEAGRYQEAASTLDAVQTGAYWTGGARAAVEQQRLAWLADTYYRMERYEAAEEAATAAARILHRIGDREGALLRASFADKMTWLTSTDARHAGLRNSSLFSLD